MAHAGRDTGGSFLVLAPQPHLDGCIRFWQGDQGLDIMQALEIGDEIKTVKF